MKYINTQKKDERQIKIGQPIYFVYETSTAAEICSVSQRVIEVRGLESHTHHIAKCSGFHQCTHPRLITTSTEVDREREREEDTSCTLFL
jgi:hypothetical protein